jgi:hypothetical protein
MTKARGLRPPGLVDEAREPVRPLVAAPREQSNVVAISVDEQAEAVVLRFVQPLRTGWVLRGDRRQAGFEGAGRHATAHYPALPKVDVAACRVTRNLIRRHRVLTAIAASNLRMSTPR